MSPSTTMNGGTSPVDGSDAPKKRRKGATRLSCAECRRLKLRCDRGIPCSSCIKRGCRAICPDGSLTTGQGNRFVLATTQELHEKINDLAQRVRDLEDGLRASHSQLSSEPHPLLSEELLKIKAPLQREPSNSRSANGSSGQVKEEEIDSEIPDAFGSLSISTSGRTKYYGHIASSWLFLQNESPEEDAQDDPIIQLRGLLPVEILKRASALPVSPLSTLSNLGLNTLQWFLPYAEQAQVLSSIFYSHAAWMYNPINKETFEEEVYTLFYPRDLGLGSTSMSQSNTNLPEEPITFHRLSLLFMVLAIGSLMNSGMPAYNLDAEKYHQLARAALFHTSLFDEPTLNAVQALFLMTYYMFLADRHGSNTGARWGIMGITIKVAQSIGLHRDSGRWGVDPGETQRRREIFWELFTYDSWQCYTFGRPPSFALAHIDTKMPFLQDTSDEHAFHAWKHKFSSECMNLFHDQAFGAKTPTYSTVIQLDRKMRAFPVPPILQVAGFGNDGTGSRGPGQDTVQLTLQRHIVLAIREMNLLYLHRSFFARAMSDHPKDPLGSPYGTSVIAAYRSAGSLVALMRNLHNQLKEPSERMWFLWTHMFSCAIVLGSIVTRCPSMSLAPSALVQLDSACELFSKAARGFRATKVLSIMMHLREKAHYSLEEYRRGNGSPLSRMNPGDPSSPADEDDELSILGGKTRLVSDGEPSSPRLLERSPTTQNPVVPLPIPSTMQTQLDHNTLMYLRSFNQQGQQQQQQQQQLPHQQVPMSAAPLSQTSSTGSFMDAMQSPQDYSDMSPVSMFGMSTMPQATSYNPQNTTNAYQQQQQQYQSTPGTSSQGYVSDFPQYFPVYDYGAGLNNSGMSLNGGTQNMGGFGGPGSPQLETPSQGGPHRRGSGSPEAATLQATWQDFVATMGI
ncbi:fungal-specific transcription factor domain-containing protein [Coprinopsis sp. MPI-PUGE-AT-0042]|nr:fungal-specific transcription factor domain-containing protein [Coprinopsis sp. MPI-PUGE-AT-0042]